MSRTLLVVAILVTLGGTQASANATSVAPGDAIEVIGGPGECTVGFLFAGSDGGRYMSTAGHCLFGQKEAKRSWKPGSGPEVASDSGRIGRLVFAENIPTATADDFFDFALIRLDEGVSATPTVGRLTAPAGMNDSRQPGPAVLRLTGRGTGVSLVAPEREVVAATLERPDHVYAHGAVVFGDSGAPVVDENGAAVGTVLGAGGIPYGVGIGSVEVGHDAALNRIGRLPTVLRHATAALNLRLRLVVAP